MNKNKGFTLAEVLITLAIIGVIATILFPSILANYNNRTLKAKRQALIGRMSQAMGELADQFRNYEDIECTDNNDLTTCIDKGTAIKFVNDGLSKVYKIAAVCDNDSLSSCDIPDEIIKSDGSTFSLKEKAKSFLTYNPQINLSSDALPYDTNSVGFMTKNGESILLFYNPNCETRSNTLDTAVYTESKVCVNMIYDLNGAKKKPNRMGDDIGIMSVFFSDAPYLASPKAYDWKAVPDYDITHDDTTTDDIIVPTTTRTYDEVKESCSRLGENIGLPSYEEGMAMQLNRELYDPIEDQKVSGYFWTSTMARSDHAWMILLENSESNADDRHLTTFLRNIDPSLGGRIARCVYKN